MNSKCNRHPHTFVYDRRLVNMQSATSDNLWSDRAYIIRDAISRAANEHGISICIDPTSSPHANNRHTAEARTVISRAEANIDWLTPTQPHPTPPLEGWKFRLRLLCPCIAQELSQVRIHGAVKFSSTEQPCAYKQPKVAFPGTRWPIKVEFPLAARGSPVSLRSIDEIPMPNAPKVQTDTDSIGSDHDVVKRVMYISDGAFPDFSRATTWTGLSVSSRQRNVI